MANDDRHSIADGPYGKTRDLEADMATGANVVCISRAAAACGEEIGHALAAQLGLRYVDDEVIRLAAERAGIDPTVVAEADVPKSLVTRLIDAIDALPATVAQPGAWLGLHPNAEPLSDSFRSLSAVCCCPRPGVELGRGLLA